MRTINILCIVGIIFFYSCNEKGSTINPTPSKKDSILTKIDSFPHLNISYKLLDSGLVQFYNNSTNYDVIRWAAHEKFPFSSQKNPKFRFQANGTYNIGAVLYKNFYGIIDTTFKINIVNAVKLDKDRLIEGTIFDESIKFVSANNDYLQNYDTRGLEFEFINRPCTKMMVHTPPNDSTNVVISIADCNQEQGTDMSIMRKNLIMGTKNIVKQDDSTKWSFGWGLFIYIKSSKNQQVYYGNGNNPNDFLEITDVREVYQPYLFPNHENTAFLVTFHFKTITQDGKKIDLIIPVKYMVYKASDWY